MSPFWMGFVWGRKFGGLFGAGYFISGCVKYYQSASWRTRKHPGAMLCSCRFDDRELCAACVSVTFFFASLVSFSFESRR